MKRKTYYAHYICIYRHLVESQEVAAIRERFKGSVVNPAKYDYDPEKRRDTIGFCLRLIVRCLSRPRTIALYGKWRKKYLG